MLKALKISSRVVLVLGLIILSLKPSIVNHLSPCLVHPHHTAFSRFTSLSRKAPLCAGAGLRCSFHKDEDKRYGAALVVAVPQADALIFDVSLFNLGISPVPSLASLAPSRTAVLRI